MQINTVYLQGQEEAKGYNNPDKIILHHPEWYGTIQSLNNLMRDSMNYYMIGYNFYVRKDGTVWQGRPVWATSANCYGQNNSSIGIAFEGNYDKDLSMPEAQFNAGVWLINHLKSKYGISEVGPHYKYYNTDCPGKHFPVSEMLNAVNNGGGDYSPNESTSSSSSGQNYTGSDTNAKVVDVSSVLNVRELASTDATIIGKLQAGERVKVNTTVQLEGWYSIYFGNSGGFVSSKYIQLDEKPHEGSNYTGSDTNATIINVSSHLNVRSGAGTGYSVLGELPAGERVKVNTSVNINGWYSIYYGNHGGFVSADYVKLDTGVIPEPKHTENDKVYGKVVNVSSVLNVRKRPSTDSEIVGTLKPDEKVRIDTDVKLDGWYSTYYGEHGGFVSSKYIEIV